MRSPTMAAAAAWALAGCSVDVPDFEYDILGDEDVEADPLCEEDFAVCGDLLVPSPLEGEPRLLAVALYRSVPPAGPPDHTMDEVEAPDVPAGGRYKVRLHPMLETGEFFVWANLYMEGGGRYIPINGVDFVSSTDEALIFDGGAVHFGDMRLTLAEGW